MKKKILGIMLTLSSLVCLIVAFTVCASAKSYQHECHGLVFDELNLDGQTTTLTEGNYYLSEDMGGENSVLLIDNGKTVNLCLNGHKLTLKYFEIGECATLNIYDDEDGTGLLSFVFDDPNIMVAEKTEGIILNNESILNVYGGTIESVGYAIKSCSSSEYTQIISLEGGKINVPEGTNSYAMYLQNTDITVGENFKIITNNESSSVGFDSGKLVLKGEIVNNGEGTCVYTEKSEGVIELYAGARLTSGEGAADIYLDNYDASKSDYTIKVCEKLTSSDKITISNANGRVNALVITDFLPANEGSKPTDFFELISPFQNRVLKMDGNDIRIAEMEVTANNGNAACNVDDASLEWYEVNYEYRKATPQDFTLLQTLDEGADEVDSIYDSENGSFSVRQGMFGKVSASCTNLCFMLKKGTYTPEGAVLFTATHDFSVKIKVNGNDLTLASPYYDDQESDGKYDAPSGAWQPSLDGGFYILRIPIEPLEAETVTIECELLDDLTVAKVSPEDNGEFSALVYLFGNIEIYVEKIEVLNKVCDGAKLVATKSGNYVCRATYAGKTATGAVYACKVAPEPESISAQKNGLPAWAIVLIILGVLLIAFAGLFFLWKREYDGVEKDEAGNAKDADKDAARKLKFFDCVGKPINGLLFVKK